MASRQGWGAVLAGVICLALTGCATQVPQMQKFGESQAVEAVREGNLVSHIKCELRQAVYDVVARSPTPNAPTELSVDWLRDWGAQASLKLVIDEKAGVTPGLTLNNPMRNVIKMFASGGSVTISQAQTTALAASLNSDATRTETIGFFYPFKELIADQEAENTVFAATGRSRPACSRAQGMLIDGDLRIKDFINSKILASRVPGLYAPLKTGASPFSTFTYEVTFVVSGGGSITPSWKLVQVSANPAGAFLNASRTRTSDLILTLGPAPNGAVSPDVRDAHLADLIGRAVAQSIASRQP